MFSQVTEPTPLTHRETLRIMLGLLSAVGTVMLGSTVVGEAADTILFCLIAFGGVISGATMVNYILVGYLWKVAVETLCLPITYRVIAAVKRREPTYAAAG